MELVHVTTRNEQKQFLYFLKEVYKDNIYYRDNTSYMLKQLFNGSSSFQNNKKFYPIIITSKGQVVCECIIIYTGYLKDTVQIGFFEALPNCGDAVEMLLEEAKKIGKRHSAQKIVVGMNGHVNYGLGFLCNYYNEMMSFGTSYNPDYYLDYFEKIHSRKIKLCSYQWNIKASRVFKKYEKLFSKIEKNLNFRFLDPNHLKRDAKFYTDLNNECFKKHKYYYQREYQEDYEMLKELLLLIDHRNLIFAFKDDRPVGFVLWYKNFNELLKPKEKIGLKTIIKNKMFGHKIKTGKVAEIAVVEEYKKTGLASTLLNKAKEEAEKQKIYFGETSWILEENSSSNNLCQKMQNDLYKNYVVYEIEI